MNSVQLFLSSFMHSHFYRLTKDVAFKSVLAMGSASPEPLSFIWIKCKYRPPRMVWTRTLQAQPLRTGSGCEKILYYVALSSGEALGSFVWKEV